MDCSAELSFAYARDWTDLAEFLLLRIPLHHPRFPCAKSVDISKYKTYSCMKRASPPMYLVLAVVVMGAVDEELQKK